MAEVNCKSRHKRLKDVGGRVYNFSQRSHGVMDGLLRASVLYQPKALAPPLAEKPRRARGPVPPAPVLISCVLCRRELLGLNAFGYHWHDCGNWDSIWMLGKNCREGSD